MSRDGRSLAHNDVANRYSVRWEFNVCGRMLCRTLHCLIAAALCSIGAGSAAIGAAAVDAPVTVKLIAFNDFHGAINPPASRTLIDDPQHPGSTLSLPTGGIEYLSSLIAQLKAQNGLNAVVAAGDLVGSSPLVSAAYRDEPTIELLGLAGLEFSAVGNHEFDAGWGELLRKQRRSRFQYLAANVRVRSTDELLFLYGDRKSVV